MNWNSNNIYLVRITFAHPEKYRLEWGGGGGGDLPLLFCKGVYGLFTKLWQR